MKVVYCGQLDWYPDAMDHLGIKQGMEVLNWDWHIVDPTVGKPSGDEIADKINTIDPELVIHGNTDSLTELVCPKVNASSKQIFWMLDYRTPEMLGDKTWNHWKENAPYLDTIFVSARDHIKQWKDAFNVPTYFAPHACWIPPDLQYNETFAHDVLFIGGSHPSGPLYSRTALIREINKLVPITFINGTKRDERNLIWKNMPLYYYSSKVVLDISHFWDNWGYCSGRYWYTATLGGCAVTKRFPGCYQFFPDTFKWYFDSASEAADLIKALLSNESERKLTKNRVSRHAWRNHNYKIRFQQMLLCLDTQEQVPMY
jgi:hypothetical protein